MTTFNGVDLDGLQAIETPSLVPDPVPGRVASIDGDALCYVVAAVCEEEAFESCKQTFIKTVENRTALCGALKARVHLTGANKGNRYEYARVKEYQANRKDKVKPKHLELLRSWIQSAFTPGTGIEVIMNEMQEADDGMSQDNYNACMAGTPELSVIHSIDKDLKMCSGYHCDWNTFEIREVVGYGSIELDRSGSTVKCIGYGTAFFWAQMLMGDTADCIPGLPTIKGELALRLASKAVLDAAEKVRTGLTATGKPLTGQQVTKAKEKVQEFMAKGKSCGAVGAYEMLKDCQDDLSAMTRVVRLYREHYGDMSFNFVDWRGWTHNLTAGDMVIEQARLLWMRRVPDEKITDWFVQVVNGGTWDG